MTEAYWTPMDGIPDPLEISWGQTADPAFLPPELQGTLGFHSLMPVEGFSGLVNNESGFNPIAGNLGGVVSSFIRKYSQILGYSPRIFFGNSKAVGSCMGYFLALSQEWPYRILLCKGLATGPAKTGDTTVLRTSDALFLTSEWLHLQLSICVNPQGDVVLRTRRDLTLSPAMPMWDPINGMDDYIDDVLGGNQGEPSIRGDFYFGLGHHNASGSGKVSLFDFFMGGRQDP
jgi:hypothetical protein